MLLLSLKNWDSYGLEKPGYMRKPDFNSSRPGKSHKNELNRHFYDEYKLYQLCKALKYFIFDILHNF